MPPPTPTRADASPSDEILVRSRVRRLIGRFGFTASDREDLEQELRWHLVRCRERFDPTRVAWSTYAGGTVDLHIKELIRARLTGMRDYRRVQSGGLDAVGSEPESEPSAHHLEDRTEWRRSHVCDLRMDLSEVMAGLGNDDRVLCSLLAQENVSAVSRRLNLPRWRIYQRLTSLRARFHEAGLHAYL